MRFRRLLPLLALTPTLLFTPSAPTPTPLPGPGGVLHAVTSFLAARDAADQDSCAQLLAEEPELLQFRPNGEGFDLAGGAASRFFAVDLDGTPVAAATTPEQFARLAIATHRQTGIRVVSELREIGAACTSERVSRAVLHFDRLIYRGEELLRRQPMRATATLRWSAGEGPDFRIYHWHESPAAKAPASQSPETRRERDG